MDEGMGMDSNGVIEEAPARCAPRITAGARAWDSLQLRAVRSQVWVQQRTRAAGRPDRGDVPGWVLVTLMTAGIVTALWILAGPLLEGLFQRAVNDVHG